MITKITNHLQQARDRLLQQYKNKQRIADFLDSILFEIQTLEDVFFDLKDNRTIDNAVGINLDRIGAIVVAERIAGEDDELYRIRIRERIILNVYQGTPENLMEAVRFLMSSTFVWYQVVPPAAADVFTNTEIDPSEVAFYKALIKRFLPAGVALDSLGFFPEENALRFNIGTGFGDVNDPSVGDLFAEVY